MERRPVDILRIDYINKMERWNIAVSTSMMIMMMMMMVMVNDE